MECKGESAGRRRRQESLRHPRDGITTHDTPPSPHPRHASPTHDTFTPPTHSPTPSQLQPLIPSLPPSLTPFLTA
ncbi:hypothetical protein Pmani_018708 [Petrolisthes manimaculis]|uniref:Uncharacterized protein n=1 Tax=Petrolisthes manimaculis TaxID=1843537 RepID=A0AAE1PJ93_9EUCA|nr:hypothetical protein Pmani_018708 [Petrolisthes manimaculis]